MRLPWASPAAQRRQADVEAALPADTSKLLERIDALVERNTEIHQIEALNLNPASNVMSPRAETALNKGLSTRASLGHAGDKYEMGLEAVEELELITTQLACRVFGSAYAEIRTLSGAMSNLIAFMACAEAGDSIIVPPAAIGGHVTHNVDGAAGLYGLDIHEAPVDPGRYTVDVDALRSQAKRVRPKLISLGSSLNLLPHPVADVRAIADEVGAIVLFDAAHACGLFAGRHWPNPLEQGAHLMTMSTYKSLAGPTGGLIVTNEPTLAERIDSIAYPGMTANFDVGRTTALAVTLIDWLECGTGYMAEMAACAAALSHELSTAGVPVFETTEGPTASHQFALHSDDGHEAALRLRRANLLTSAIGLPSGSGVRIGTPEAVRWGMTSDDMATLAGFISRGLRDEPETVADDVSAFRRGFDTVHFCR